MSLTNYVQTFHDHSFLFETKVAKEHVIVIIVTTILGYHLLNSVYLLYFHPLAKFAGPRRAALSTWWIYFASRKGDAEKVFEELHCKYNTRALRIAPNEIHISESTLYHTLYSQDHAYVKPNYFYDAFGTPHSVFVETDRGLHRQRRKMLQTFFSKSSIRSMQNVLFPKLESICSVLSERSRHGSVNIYNAIRCMTVDVISDLAFGEPLGLLSTAKGNYFDTEFLHLFDLAADSIWDLMYLPALRAVLLNLPTALTTFLGGPTARFARLSQRIEAIVSKYQKGKVSGKLMERDVVFDALPELSKPEMMGEATDILVAGSDTTATTLAYAVQQLIENPKVYATLRTEIRNANLCTEKDYDLRILEQLPYLSACVKEALRFATAVPGRLPRIVPPPSGKVGVLMIEDTVVPPGTIVGISAYTVHFDEKIWGDNARQFQPERWLGDEGKQLEKYLVTFSKGARQCLGINLANAELTLALAMLITRFEFEKDDTLTQHDLQLKDGFTAGFRGSGPRVRLTPL